MSGPARAGAVIFAKDVARVTEFYCQVMGMARQVQDAQHAVIRSADLQLVIHAIPEAIAAELVIASPPSLRAQAALKLFVTVPSLEAAAAAAQALGGGVHGYRWNGPGFVGCDGHDCEGNVFQLRQMQVQAPAQAGPKGYWVARVDVHDADPYKAYAAANGVAFAKYGGRFVVRAGRFENPAGGSRSRNVVIEFPTYQAALDCWQSPEYQAAARLREGASVMDLVIIEGYQGEQPQLPTQEGA